LYLYRKQLAKELDGLSSQPELNFICPPYEDSHTVEAGHHLPPDQRLALCVYFIERNFHFTGDGIWADIIVPTVTSESGT
jgi:hypothetical protein